MTFEKGDRVEFSAKIESNFSPSYIKKLSGYNGSTGTILDPNDGFESHPAVKWDEDTPIADFIRKAFYYPSRAHRELIYCVNRINLRLHEYQYDPNQQGDRGDDV